VEFDWQPSTVATVFAWASEPLPQQGRHPVNSNPRLSPVHGKGLSIKSMRRPGSRNFQFLVRPRKSYETEGAIGTGGARPEQYLLRLWTSQSEWLENPLVP